MSKRSLVLCVQVGRQAAFVYHVCSEHGRCPDSCWHEVEAPTGDDGASRIVALKTYREAVDFARQLQPR
jgi:hypothetical protein